MLLLPAAISLGATGPRPTLVNRGPLPVELNRDFQFRKTKLYFLTESEPGQEKTNPDQQNNGQATGKGGNAPSTAPSTKSTSSQAASFRFERPYRLFGAITKLDNREGVVIFFVFFWRARRVAVLTLQSEEPPSKLHSPL